MNEKNCWNARCHSVNPPPYLLFESAPARVADPGLTRASLHGVVVTRSAKVTGKQLPTIGASPYRHSSPAGQMDDEKDQGEHEEHPRDLPRNRSYAEQTQGAGDETHDQENQRIVEHRDLLPDFGQSACLTTKSQAISAAARSMPRSSSRASAATGTYLSHAIARE